MSAKGIRVTCEDLDTGESNSVVVPMNEYFIVTTGGCCVTHTNVYPKSGTHVLTIKGRAAPPTPQRSTTETNK